MSSSGSGPLHIARQPFGGFLKTALSWLWMRDSGYEVAEQLVRSRRRRSSKSLAAERERMSQIRSLDLPSFPWTVDKQNLCGLCQCL